MSRELSPRELAQIKARHEGLAAYRTAYGNLDEYVHIEDAVAAAIHVAFALGYECGADEGEDGGRHY